MKSKLTKRIIALVLCMAMVLGCGTYALADDAGTDAGAASQIEQTISAETDTEVAGTTASPEETQDIVVEENNATTYDVSNSETIDVSAEETTEATETDVEATVETPENVIEGITLTGEGVAIESSETEIQTAGFDVTEEPVVEEVIIELSQEVDGTTIILSGPESSFEAGKQYTIEVAKVENTETIETIEAALEELEDEETVINEYHAFDIKLFADGVETQPLGPVSVRFSGDKVAESVSNEETETTVIHVDETTGETEDMSAVATEENDVEIETTHFSIYVIVDTGEVTDHITVDIEHYGTVKTIAPWTVGGKASATWASGATATTNPFSIHAYGSGSSLYFLTKDGVFNRSTTINTINYTGQLYKTDEDQEIPNLYENSIEELSKVCEATSKVDPNYEIEKVDITVDGKTTTYQYSDNPTITLKKDATIRFYYKERATSNIWQEPAVFYDYNVTTDGGWYHTGSGAGSNTSSNFTGSGAKMAIGQWVSGNQAAWNWNGNRNTTADGLKSAYNNTTMGKTFLENADSNVSLYGQNDISTGTDIGTLNIGGGYGNNDRGSSVANSSTYKYRRINIFNKYSGDTTTRYNYYGTGYEVRKGLTKSTISKVNGSYQLAYNSGIQQPGFFESGKVGTLVLDDYTLGFKQTGNTYVLSTVYRDGTKVNTSVKKGGNKDYSQLMDMSSLHPSGDYTTRTISNNFWPLDSLTQADYTAAGVNYKMDKRPSVSEIESKTGSANLNDDGTSGNHNWHFGMRYEFKFTIGDYTGPMNYYFRGDDDFWLYIDGKKAIEIGGIHSAAGQALDVRHWLETYYPTHLDDPDYEYTVSIFFMERGGYGSCCYMQYTLPNCIQVDIPVSNSTQVTVDKTWLADDSLVGDVEVTLYRNDVAYKTATLNASNGWSYTWKNLSCNNPNTGAKYTYRVAETSTNPAGVESTIEGAVDTPVATITNTQYIDIPVEKVWSDNRHDEDDYYGLRPESIQVKLLADGVQVGDVVTLSDDNSWKASWTHLPKYKMVDNTKTLIVYSVEEVSVPEHYTVSYDNNYGTEEFDGTFTVTNTIITDVIRITKTGSADGSLLEGAKFELTSTSNKNFPTAVAITGDDGIANFEVPRGTYVLKEIEAPDGFVLLGDAYTIKLDKNGGIYWIGDNEAEKATLDKDGTIYVISISNEPLYALPETGGPGIYAGMLCGLACLMAAAFTFHRRRCRVIVKR